MEGDEVSTMAQRFFLRYMENHYWVLNCRDRMYTLEGKSAGWRMTLEVKE